MSTLRGALLLSLLAVGCQGLISDPGTGPGSPPGTRPPGTGPGRQTPEACAGVTPLPLDGESQRLDATELGNALEGLLGFRPTLAPGFPNAVRGPVGYTTYPSANRITKRDVGLIADTADDIALQAIEHFDTLLPCAPTAIDETCVDAFVDDFAPRALRGASAAPDLAELKSLYRTLRSGDPVLDPPVAVAGVISAILQAPGFLYLVERGDAVGSARVLTGLEIANRLAFVLWDGPPDAALLDAARDGSLATPAGRRAQAERMLEAPAARTAVVRFFREWLGVGMRSPDVDPALVTAFEEELRRFVEDAVFGDTTATLEQLVTSDSTFVNRTLAMHYGLAPVPASDADWTRATRSDGLHAGILGLGSVADAHGSQTATSTTRRGRFIRERFLCEDIADPPPDAMAANPVLPDDATVRERIEARMAVPACGYCHSLMDPIGIGMEDLDHLGRFRVAYEDGSPIDRAGEVMSLDATVPSSTFEGANELSTLLASDDRVPACAVRQFFRFAMGRVEGDCQTAAAQLLFEEGGHGLRELLVSIIASDSFVSRSEGGS